ncbi:MAG: starch-binding protein [Muribaculaceae bacterium]|nr:starch-binding protein [Muribaculaceae bacterium]
MNIRNIFRLLLPAVLVLLAGSCSKDEIIFDHELPQFETRAGLQLLEVIMPQGTSTTDRLYIVGEFNGGLEGALSDPRWQLEKASDTDAKWGIYLNPADFADGKTLADGYYFYSKEQREERTLKNEEILHTEAPALGGRLNITAQRWAAYFDKPLNPDEVVHDGYVIYVLDHSGYEELAMYAYGDAEAFGGWPGIRPTGTLTIEGTTFSYFDTGEANKGMSLNLIFNNNGNGKQMPDYPVVLESDIYLELTESGAMVYDPNANITHDGFAVFVADYTGWDELRLYMWGDVNDLNGAWPGMSPTGKQAINGVTYTYFDLGEANIGTNEHVILNNNNGKQFDDVVVFGCDRDVYIELTATGFKEVNPEEYTGLEGEAPVEPEPEEPLEPEEPGQTYKLYIQDLTGWSAFYVYAWGDKEAFGPWPGATSTTTETIGGVSYKVFTMEGRGEGLNLIFNDNNGTQYDALGIHIDRDYYIVAGADKAQEKE